MSYYAELIFGARLRKNTPIRVITNLRWLIEGDDTFGVEDMLYVPHNNPLNSSSGNFGVSHPLSKIWWDEEKQQTEVSVRSCINNIHSDIELFLAWIEPYIEKGAGVYHFYAIVTGEDENPRLYFKFPPDVYQ